MFMKKVIIVPFKNVVVTVLILVVLIGGAFLTVHCILKDAIATGITPIKSYFEPAKSPEGSLEELYRDVSISLLEPFIYKAIDDFYGDDYAIDPGTTRILSIDRPNGYRTFYFIVKLEVIPYYGPHIGVGIDRLTITIGGFDNVKVEKFEHIKSFELPPKLTKPIN